MNNTAFLGTMSFGNVILVEMELSGVLSPFPLIFPCFSSDQFPPLRIMFASHTKAI